MHRSLQTVSRHITHTGPDRQRWLSAVVLYLSSSWAGHSILTSDAALFSLCPAAPCSSMILCANDLMSGFVAFSRAMRLRLYTRHVLGGDVTHESSSPFRFAPAPPAPTPGGRPAGCSDEGDLLPDGRYAEPASSPPRRSAGLSCHWDETLESAAVPYLSPCRMVRQRGARELDNDTVTSTDTARPLTTTGS
jgi:hypothetical protein